jgi:uncharacterized protein (DUF305 family)
MYLRLAAMIGVSFAWMYAAMFAMVATSAHVQQNLNSVYMAALMAGAMIPIEITFMRSMYRDARLNVIALAVAGVILAGSFLAIRVQAGVGDEQFLRSMIPHHSSAILMCRQASVQDAEIRELCDRPNGIVDSQSREIDQMNRILERRSGH